MAVGQAVLPGARRGVLCIADARWLRWAEGCLEVGDGQGRVQTLGVPQEQLTLVGRAFAGLTCRDGDRRVAVSARFDAGATVLVERRGGRCAVAASPGPRLRAAARKGAVADELGAADGPPAAGQTARAGAAWAADAPGRGE